MVTIIDYGMGNLGSIQNILKRIGVASIVTSDLVAIQNADKIILPGVGAFDHAMTCLNGGGLRSLLAHKALDEKVPILGICLGMQLLTRSSEEGQLPGLGWIPATTTRLRLITDTQLKIPHMGWNVVSKSTPSPLTSGFDTECRFYFVHSYCVHVDDQQHSILKAHHGVEFDAGIQKGNIFGVQFHPEKSHRFGMALLENFANV